MYSHTYMMPVYKSLPVVSLIMVPAIEILIHSWATIGSLLDVVHMCWHECVESKGM